MNIMTRNLVLLAATMPLAVPRVQALEITEVGFEQSRDGSKQVLVGYTLLGDSADVGLYLSTDGGLTFTHLREGVTGERGPGTPPGPHTMTLDLAALDSVVTPEAVLKVSAFRWEEGIRVPAGTFTMGSDSFDVCAPPHEVTLTRDYWMGRHPVTNAEFVEALQWAWDNTDELSQTLGWVNGYGHNLARVNYLNSPLQYADGVFSTPEVFLGEYAGQPADLHPVVNVTVYGAAAYCDWRSRMEGLQPFYQGNWHQTPDHNPYTAQGYRLPTEAEYERAARYPDDRLYPWGDQPPDCELTNYEPCVGGTSPVGVYPAGNSALGFCDLAGNVAVVCGDRWQNNFTNAEPVDPLGPQNDPYFTEKGCDWSAPSAAALVFYRFSWETNQARYSHGFRIVKSSE